MKKNITLNRYSGKIVPFNLDARDFIKMVFKEVEEGIIKHVNHFYFNLPAIGYEFLDVMHKVPLKMLLKGIYCHVTCFEEV